MPAKHPSQKANSLALWIIAFIFLIAIAGMYVRNHKGSSVTNIPLDQDTPTLAETVADTVERMPLREKIAGLLILHTSGTDASSLKAFVTTYHPAGLILMGDNIPATLEELDAETAAIQKSAPEGFPFLIATDEEGCTVRRLGSDTFPCPSELNGKPVEETKEAFTSRSELLARVGINLNFGIVADITSDPNSFIYDRVFSGNPSIAGERVGAAVEGTEGFTLSTLKHFPGHGETPADSHSTIPVVSISKSQWEQTDAVPFQMGIRAGADLVMMGHLKYTSIDNEPASLSSAWHRILRDELGFEGVIITDDMLMLEHSGEAQYADSVQNAIAALNAGNTLLLYVNDHGEGSELDVNALLDGLVRAVQNGTISENLINQNLARVLTLRGSLRTL